MPKESGATQQFVDIEEVKDGVLVLKNGGLRRVLMVAGLNFELKAEEEQNVIMLGFQSFLNSLDFSIQFLVHSRKLNIDGYLEKLRQRKETESNELLQNQISEYIEFIRSFVEMNAVMAKTFFVVVPYDPIVIPQGGKRFMDFLKFGRKIETPQIEETAEQKYNQLNQRVDQAMNGLNQVGLRSVALDDTELTELFYNLYNPETVEKKELKILRE